MIGIGLDWTVATHRILGISLGKQLLDFRCAIEFSRIYERLNDRGKCLLWFFCITHQWVSLYGKYKQLAKIEDGDILDILAVKRHLYRIASVLYGVQRNSKSISIHRPPPAFRPSMEGYMSRRRRRKALANLVPSPILSMRIKVRDIRGGSGKLVKRGPSAGRREPLGGSGGMPPREILKSGPSKTAIPCLSRP